MPCYIMGGLLAIHKYRWMGLWMVVCAVLAIVVSDQSSNLIKQFVHRLRPCAVEDVRLLVKHCSETFSFTSNHAANHFAIAVFLSLALRQIRWLVYVLVFWAAFISLAQVYVGLHYPADIVGGAMLGILAGYAAFMLFSKLGYRYKLFESMITFE